VVWVAITVLLNALIVPLSLSGLEAAPLWVILGSRWTEAAWSAGLGLLSTLCVCGCLWADVVSEGSGLAERYEAHLLGRISDLEAQRDALRAQVESAPSGLSVAPADASSAASAAPNAASVASNAASPAPRHSACHLCGFWSANQRQVAGHIAQCRRRAERSTALTGEMLEVPSSGSV